MRPESKKRAKQRTLRGKVREQVLQRANYECEYRWVIPEVPCGYLPGRYQLEVDELRGGAYRITEWLDPTRCVCTCPRMHDWKTLHKNLVIERFEVWRTLQWMSAYFTPSHPAGG